MHGMPVPDSKINLSSPKSTKDSVKHLFSPFRFKGLTLKNRIVLPALASFMIEDDGSITDKTVNHYRLRAAGGPAMVIAEACAVSGLPGNWIEKRKEAFLSKKRISRINKICGSTRGFLEKKRENLP